MKKTIHIYCDGGFGNRYNALVSGLAIARLLQLEPLVYWPCNNWCRAPFDALFVPAGIPFADRSLSSLKGTLGNLTPLLHDDLGAKVLGVGFNSAYAYRSVEDARTALHASDGFFYYPALLPEWVPQSRIDAAVHSLSFHEDLTAAAHAFIRDQLGRPYYGVHLRRTDLQAGLTDGELKSLVTAHPDSLFFVCSDDPLAERMAAAHPNVRVRQKRSYVGKRSEGASWNALTLDDDQRAYYSNIERGAASVVEALVDLLILAHSVIVGFSGSTFQSVARLIGRVAPLIDLPRLPELPFLASNVCYRQLRAKRLSVTDVIALGEQFMAQDRREEGVQFLQAALNYFHDAHAFPILFNLAVALAGAGRVGEAEVFIERAIRAKPGHLDSYNLAARICHASGRQTQALQYLSMARAGQSRTEDKQAHDGGRREENKGHIDEVGSGDDRRAGAPNLPGGAKNRLVVYTVLVGDKEPLGNPLSRLPGGGESDLHIEFVCFTDNRALQSDVWKFEYLDGRHLPPEKMSRRPKALPHEYLRDSDLSLYIDNIVTFKRLPTSDDLKFHGDYLFRVFPHATRRQLMEEADAIAILGYDDVDKVCGQLDFYAAIMPLDTIKPVSTCTVILRTHNHPKLIEFGVAWWEHILNFSRRDQMSFDFVAKRIGCALDYFKGLKHDNDLIHDPVNIRNNRVMATFDSTRYAWVNRHDPEARRNPKAHFLAGKQKPGIDYSRRPALLDYLCHKFRSSLGTQVAPRRCVSNTLGDVLERYRDSGRYALLVRISGDTSRFAFSDDEFRPAELAIHRMLGHCSANLMEVAAQAVRQSSVVFANVVHLFDVLIVIGLPADCLGIFFEKFSRILNPTEGLIAVVAAGEGELDQVALAGKQIETRYSAKCRIAINGSRHDDSDRSIDNSFICFEWTHA